MNEQLIRELAGKLGTTADHLWVVLIRQAGVAAITDGLWIVALTVAITAACKLIMFLYRRGEDEMPLVVIVGIVGVVMLFVWGIVAQSIVTEIANPEYWALQQILSAVHK